jgi:hypothetical protein
MPGSRHRAVRASTSVQSFAIDGFHPSGPSLGGARPSIPPQNVEYTRRWGSSSTLVKLSEKPKAPQNRGLGAVTPRSTGCGWRVYVFRRRPQAASV